MSSLFDGTESMGKVTDIYKQMEANYRGSPCSESGELWLLRRVCHISPRQRVRKTMLDKAVASLAERGHMPEWFNRCPVAAGIVDPYKDNNYRVDLVHRCKLCRCARLIELEWKSNNPLDALRQILRYGAAYLFCRGHKGKLKFPAESLIEMNVRHVSLEVIAPQSFCQNLIAQITKSHCKFIDNSFVDSKVSGLSMSLNVLAFPDGFQIPFANGKEVKDKCDTPHLTPEGQAVREAFTNLAPVWP